jgi:hypothetical protein
MDITIKNGNNGDTAKVDDKGRLQTFSISEGLNIEAAKIGENYNINTGAITLTSGNESSVLFMKNNEDKSFVIEDVIVILGSSTGGSGDLAISLIRNPTTGTIITNSVDADIVSNRNFGSNRELLKDIYKGVEGDSFTNGTVFADTTRSSASTIIHFDGDVMILPKGSTIGVNITPQTGNTSMIVKVAIIGYLFD